MRRRRPVVGGVKNMDTKGIEQLRRVVGTAHGRGRNPKDAKGRSLLTDDFCMKDASEWGSTLSLLKLNRGCGRT